MGRPLQLIAEVEEGAAARVRGRVRLAKEPLRSPLLDRPCVFWEVRDAPDEKTRAQGVQPFWLEDESGRVLVSADAIRAALRGERGEELVLLPDLKVLGERIRAIKEELREAKGARHRALVQERKQLAKLATVRHAMLAQRRGRVHVGGSIAKQAAFLRANASLLESVEAAEAAMEVGVERWEGIVAEGDEIEIRGTFRRELVPSGVRMVSGEKAVGYREGTLALVVSGTGAAPLRLRGLGEKAPPRRRRSEGRKAPRRARRRQAPIDWRVALAAAVTAALSLWYWLG